MPIKFDIRHASLSLDSLYSRVQFALLRDTAGLIQHLFNRLEPGLTLQNIKIERGSGSVGDFHVACQLPNLTMSIQVRPDKVQVACVEVPESQVEPTSAALVAALSAVQAHVPELRYQSHTLVVGLHGELEGKTTKEYLGRMVANAPGALGPVLGNGGVLYFGAKDDRTLSTVTFDLSGFVRDGLFFRLYALWDGTRVSVTDLPSRVRAFLREALTSFDLDAPSVG